jgi:hypothetical protein
MTNIKPLIAALCLATAPVSGHAQGLLLRGIGGSAPASSSSGGTWSEVYWTPQGAESSSVSSLTIPLASGSANAGDCIAVFLYTDGGQSGLTVAAGSESFTADSNDGYGGFKAYYLADTAGGETSISVSNTGNHLHVAYAEEFHYSTAACTAFDNSSYAAFTSGSTSPATSAFTVTSGDVVVGTLVDIAGSSVAITPGSGFTALSGLASGGTTAGAYSGTNEHGMVDEWGTAASTSDTVSFSLPSNSESLRVGGIAFKHG